MRLELRVVLDTNVIVSALLFRNSVPRIVFDHVLDHCLLLQAIGTLAELEDVLKRPKFDGRLSLQDRMTALAEIAAISEPVRPGLELRKSRDHSDDKFLELAMAGRADYLVTGDDDLLVLGSVRGVRIVTPREFVQAVGLALDE